MKITAKTTKEQLKSLLGANVKAVQKKDKDLFDRIAYADKMAKTDSSKVTRKDLVDLAKEVITLLGDKIVEPVLAEVTPITPIEPQAENSVKKLSKGVSKKQESMEESVPEASTKEEKVDTKKSAKKSLGSKKEAPKKDGVIVLNTDADTKSEKAVQLAKAFPKTLTIEGDKFELAPDIKSMEDLFNALSNDEEIVFAYYWTKRHLRQFPYFSGVLGQPKSFDNDLDLCTAIYVSDEQKVAYQVSRYTEAIYTILPTDFEEEDGVRIAGGIEYQIYRAV